MSFEHVLLNRPRPFTFFTPIAAALRDTPAALLYILNCLYCLMPRSFYHVFPAVFSFALSLSLLFTLHFARIARLPTVYLDMDRERMTPVNNKFSLFSSGYCMLAIYYNELVDKRCST